MKKSILSLSLISTIALTGCVSPDRTDDPNAATKQGAAGGALLGLTMGALTGDAELAVKGAIAGGVAGGVAGASHDIQNNRENIRHDSRNDAISGITSESQPQASNNNQYWDEIERFIGEWDVSIRNSTNGSNIHDIKASGALTSVANAKINISADTGIELDADFSYSQEEGYRLDITNQSKQVSVGFVGEQLDGNQRYSFYPTNVQDVIYEGINTSDIRVELSFVGTQVWRIESYVYQGGQEQKLQEIRFTKSDS
ncbi:hypothetical protein P7F88_14375 [Vibrio hannami]|uniref:hypothetical protein n=1 Tax=Vibrio hannami TaxID=2717094 RepID=UPI00240F1B64|nr:hypothetical protein [Vibrio hannami]MDG3087196.1 hypothetical protein [Vibrio hannami]